MEIISYAREPLVAATEAFGVDYQDGIKADSDLLESRKQDLLSLKRGVMTIPKTCSILIDNPYATETLAALISEKNECLQSHWINDARYQRRLLGFMVELELGAIKGWGHQPDNEGRYLEWNQKRTEILTKFKDLLFEQEVSGQEKKE